MSWGALFWTVVIIVGVVVLIYDNRHMAFIRSIGPAFRRVGGYDWKKVFKFVVWFPVTFFLAMIWLAVVWTEGRSVKEFFFPPVAASASQIANRPFVITGEGVRFERFNCVSNVVVDPAQRQYWGFVGILPPTSRADFRQIQVSRTSPVELWTEPATLLEGILAGRNPLAFSAVQATLAQKQPLAAVMPLTMPTHIGTVHNGSNKISGLYIQPTSTDRRQEFLADLQLPTTVEQFMVTIEPGKLAEVTIPETGWTAFWVAPIFDPKYQLKLQGLPVPPRGLSLEELLERVAWQRGGSVTDALRIVVETSNAKRPYGNIPYGALYVRDGESTFLFDDYYFQWSAEKRLSGKPLVLGINLPGEEEGALETTSSFNSPRVVVGLMRGQSYIPAPVGSYAPLTGW